MTTTGPTRTSLSARQAETPPSAVTCTRKIQFCAGHRVMGHENKCAHLHGHNYEVHVTAEAEVLDGIGRVLDFSVLKDRLGGWIEDHWDHGFLLWDQDNAAISALEGFLNGQQKLFLFPENPTAENLAAYILNLGNELLADGHIRIVKAVVWETPNCYAEAAAPVAMRQSTG
jgi:6-pyruvoyltetrahydropterin/6-carboxytetrahydropterin synthase